jgi:hypothetical protein
MTPQRYSVVLERNLPARMRDGVVLRADVWRPKARGPFPVLLMRTPYENNPGGLKHYAHPSWYASHGYVVVSQDCRGRSRSGGEFTPFVNEVADGADTLEWVATLPGTTGKVGMYGASYPGSTQLQAAIGNPTGVTCICPAITNDGFFDGWIYEGGALHLAFASYWSMLLASDTARRRGRLDVMQAIERAKAEPGRWYTYMPLREFPPLRNSGATPYFFDWLSHPTHDEYWKATSIAALHHRIRVPGLHIGSWYDIFLGGTLRNYAGINTLGGAGARGHQRVLIAPWAHQPISRLAGDVDFGESAVSRVVDDLQLRFFDWLLRGEDDGISSEKPVRVFVMGENAWRDEAEWPLARAVYKHFYFHSDGRAQTFSGDGTLSTMPPAAERYDTYVYDPRSPSASRGGHSCCWEKYTPMGPFDQRPAERWTDTLCYTSEPLTDAVEVTGPVSVTLWATTDAVDTDWVARLIDVHPDGTAINLTEGIIRASFRDGLEERRLLERDRVYKYRIDLRSTSNVFGPGHRIRVDVASSSFPHWDRNPNTGQPPFEATLADLQIATQTVFHDRARPSHITLPLIPR